jgi:DNA-binding MarR family transcriptional regulator
MSAFQKNLLALLHRANQIADERFATALIGSNVTARQLQVLAAIEANEGASQTDIVGMTGIDRSTLADITRRLSKRKLIERRRTKADARAYAVKLTEAGRQELANGKPALVNVEKILLRAIPAKLRADLFQMLEQVIASSEIPSEQKSRT